jgi:hypothetical protein
MSVINDISDVEHFNPRKIPNDELTFDWSLACSWYSDAKRLGKDFKYPMDTVLNIAEKILGEISQRVASGEMKMEFNTKTMKKDSKQLFNLTFRKLSEGKQKFIVCNDNAPQMPAIKATDFPSIVWIPDFISLAGSTLYAKGREPNDRDIIVRADSKDQNMFVRVDASLNVKLTRILDEIFKGEKNAPVQYSPSAYGPNTSYVPLYDLVLVPKDKLSITQVNEPDYADRFYDSADELVKPFTWFKQLKPMKGKFHGEAYTVESVLEVVKSRKTDWYQTGISVARKLDGVAIQCHTDGEGKVFIATEDGGDITSKLPTLVSLLRKVRTPSILIGELELYEGDKHVPRQGTIGLIHKNVVPENEPDVVFTYYDCVYWDRDIHLSDYLTRLNAPRGLPIGKNFKKLEQVVVHTEQDLAREIKSAADKEGSEGAYMKLLSFKYELDGATLENIKYKRTRQIDVKVVKVHAVEGSDSTWNYLTTLEDGTPSGNTFNTGIKAEVGDVITVDFMNLSKYTDPKTGKSWYNFWAPAVIAKKESGKADSVQTAEELVVASKGSVAEKTFPKRYLVNDVDQYNFVPSETKIWKGMAHLHIRGTSVHLDLRLQISDSELSGWTLFIPKGLSRAATSISDAKDLVNREIVPLIKETLANPLKKFNGTTKLLEPIEWASFESEVEKGGVGATKNNEGFLVIIDEFQVQFGCFPKGEKVLTQSGLLNIEDVHTGDYLLGDKNKWVRVLQTFQRDADSVTTLKIRGMGELNLTPNHRVYAIDRQKVRCLKNHKSTPGWIQSGNLKHGDMVAVPKIKTEVDLYWNIKNQKNRLETNLLIDEDIAWLYGLIMGDGHVADSKPQIEIKVAYTQKYILDRATKIIKDKLGLYYRITKCRGCWSLNFYSTELQVFLRKELYDANRKKTFPIDMLFAKKEILFNFLHGYYDADGRKAVSEKRQLELAAVNPDVQKLTCLALIKLGCVPGGTSKRSKCYKLCWLQDILDLLGGSKASRKHKHVNYLEDEDFVYLRINSVHTKKENQVVYNLETEDNTIYTPIKTHNSNKPDYHEYFVNGKIFNGRIVAVKIENKAEWEKTDEGIMTWMFFKTKTEIPYVITRRAVKKGWIPEHGFSALPREYRNKVPAVSRWWIAKEKDRLKLRDSYVESMKSSLVTDSVSGQFKLKKQIFRGPIVIRTGPSRIMYHLILKNKQGFQEFVSDNELPDTGKFQSTTKDEWNAAGVVPVKTELNPTKATHSEIEDIDGGPFRWLDKAKSIIKLEGKDFKGTFLFSKKEGSDSIQNMKRI